MLLLKPTTVSTKQSGLFIVHEVKIGSVVIGELRQNIAKVNTAPYVFVWLVKIQQPEDSFYCNSLEEAVQFATGAVRETLALMLK